VGIRNLFEYLRSIPHHKTAIAGRTSARPRRHSVLRLERLDDRIVPSFSPITSYAVGTNPQAVVSTDFDGDGRLDFALANSDHSPSVLLGNGDGTFRASGYSFGGVQSVAVGDFNGDARPDLVALFGGRDGVAVALGNGDGTFQAAQVAYIGMTPTSVVVGDLNADGKLDLVATSYSAWGSVDPYTGNSYGGSAGYANVLMGNGDGTFASNFGTYSLNEYTSGSSSALGDFNGDGKLDLAADGSVLLGNGDGTLGALRPAPMWTVAAAADVNADGKLDLVGDGVALGNGDGTFQPARLYEAAGPSVRVADFDGDGRRDLAAGTTGSFLVVQLGNGDGTFRDAYHLAAGSGPSLTVGDFDGDRRPDVVTADSSAGTVTVLLNDGNWAAPPDPTLSIGDVTVAEGNTGTTAATFTVTLSATSTQTVIVHYATADDSATVAGGDYQAASGTLTFAPGQTSKTITVLVNGDRLAEYTENFSVRLSDPTNAFVADATGVGTILDDEPTVGIVDSVSGAEGNTGTRPFTFTVTLSAAYDAPVTVDYATADLTPDEEYSYGPGATAGVDYVAKSGTVTFAAGETSKTITVLVNGDRIGESDESFSVNLSNPTSANLSTSQAIGVILNDEPYASINSTTVVEGNTGTTNAIFTVTLSAASDVPVTVTFATADGSALAGSDYQAKSGSVTFAAGETSKTLTVLVNGDRLGEYDESFSVNLTGATGAGIGNAYGYGTIQDNEPRLSINSVSIAEGNSGTKLMTFTVTLSAAYDQAVTVKYATNDWTATAGEDYVATSGTLTFAPGQTSKTFTVAIKGDKQKEANERFFISLSGASSNALISNYSGSGDILNDDGGQGKGLKSAGISISSGTSSAAPAKADSASARPGEPTGVPAFRGPGTAFDSLFTRKSSGYSWAIDGIFTDPSASPEDSAGHLRHPDRLRQPLRRGSPPSADALRSRKSASD